MTYNTTRLNLLTKLALFAAFLLCCGSVGAEIVTFVDNPDPLTNVDRPYVALLAESSWFAAEQEAIQKGGHLISIRDAAMNMWVNETFSSFLGQRRSLWIGANDVSSEGDFVWTDGTGFGFANWFRSEPNNFGGIEDSVLMLPGGQWNDADGTQRIAFGVAVIAVPEPRVADVVCGLFLLSCLRFCRRFRKAG